MYEMVILKLYFRHTFKVKINQIKLLSVKTADKKRLYNIFSLFNNRQTKQNTYLEKYNKKR